MRAFAQQPRKDAPPLFRQGDSAPTTTAASSASSGKRKEPPQPPRSVSAAWDRLPPMERMGKLHEWQAAQKSTT